MADPKPRRRKPPETPVPAPAIPESKPAPHPDLVLAVRCEDKVRRHVGVHSFTTGDDGILRLFSAAGGDPVCVYNADVWWSAEWVPLMKAPEGAKS